MEVKTIKVTVRTWKSVKDENHPNGWCEKKFLETVSLPIDAIERIQQWAKDNQILLLDDTHKPKHLSFIESQRKPWLVEMNKLFKQLQREGLKSELERLAIGFLFTQARDNPELIDLAVAADYLSQLEEPEVA